MADYPCPCCGHLVFAEPPGSYYLCPVCRWEDDPVQLRWPDYAGGANKPSLIEAQRNYARFGAVEERLVQYARPPRDDEPRDPNFRRVDPRRDPFEPDGMQLAPWPEDKTVLYFWRPAYWRM